MADIIFPGEEPAGDAGVTRLPQNVDLSIWQGDEQEFYIELTNDSGSPIDLSTSTAQAVIRASYTSPTAYTFTCSLVGGTVNKFKVFMSSADCALIPPGDYIWNFQVTKPSGGVRTYLAGDVKVYAEVD